MAKARRTTVKRKQRGSMSSTHKLRLAIELEGSVVSKFKDQAQALGLSLEDDAALMIDNGVAPEQLTADSARHAAVRRLAAVVRKLPGVHRSIGTSTPEEAFWWLKFSIDTEHPLAWHVIQRLGYVLNYYSLEYKFHVSFYPASPPPALNGGPREFLSWVIEARLRYVDPRPIHKALRQELPARLSSEAEWRLFD